MPQDSKKLTNKHKIFVAEYLACSDSTKAAVAAGYSKKTAQSQGCQLLKVPKIAAEISKQTEKRLEKLGYKADDVLSELARLGFSNMLDYIRVGSDGAIKVDMSELDRARAAAIQEVTVDEYAERTGQDEDGKPTYETVKRIKFKLADKRGALELLGKNLKLFVDRVEASGKNGGPIMFVPVAIGPDSPQEAESK